MFDNGYYRKEIGKTALRWILAAVLIVICLAAILVVFFLLGKIAPEGNAWRGIEAPVYVQRIDTHDFNARVPAWYE